MVPHNNPLRRSNSETVRRAGSSKARCFLEVQTSGVENARLFYVAKFRQVIYVLHVFRKKTRKTPKRDMTTARSRFQEVLRREALKK